MPKSQELLSFDTKVPGYGLGYSFDDIGKREVTTLEGLLKDTYTANELNQYTEIEEAGALA